MIAMPTTDITTRHDADPQYTNADERLLTYELQVRAHVATIRQLQHALEASEAENTRLLKVVADFRKIAGNR